MNRTDIEYIIEKLESYKYNSEREKRDQRVSEVPEPPEEEGK